ncbi:hypothetical protein [Deinococcus yavapaiensis]|uniref:Apolipoprotein N-acyltransferase n=1 Tax=Deinococcus yavapaiensis KR-236 TaxID=694435 RepID=A0A318STK1_9DEIO|nr:hypothetical protein [Deinococcus yavapaiensis]PYE56566.1 hypothetical protein DES52_101371 [Deinococcus yavapaiensis KR-236]
MRGLPLVTVLLLSACAFFAGRFLHGPSWWIGLAIVLSIPFSVRAREGALTRGERGWAYVLSAAGFAAGFFSA